MILTGNAIVTSALIRLGSLRFGQTSSPDILGGGLGVLNELIDSFLLDELLVFEIKPDAYTLTAALSYTIGPSGDFVAQRPTRIENANYLFANTSPVIRKPIAILTAAEWSLISVQQILQAVINCLWYEGDFSQPDGNATIHVWPGGTAGDQIELFTWKQLLSFEDLTTPHNFPPGYAEAMKYTLAEKLIPMVRLKLGKELVTSVMGEAQKARTAIMSYNARDVQSFCDPAFLVGSKRAGAWSYLTGGFGRTL